MSTFAFILGKNRDLSIAELASVLPDSSLEYLGQDYLFAATTLPCPATELLDRLGGVTKIFELSDHEFHTLKDLELAIIDFLVARFEYQERKASWGLSLFGAKRPQDLKTLLMGAKKALKSEKVSARFVNKDFQNLNSASTVLERLLDFDMNCELAVFRAGEAYRLGTLVAVQDIDSYSLRDYGRPARSGHNGMLPPKLAQIMLNLAHLQPKQTVYDPFCGSGTVLTEGLVMGLYVAGSDLEEQQVKDATENCTWLGQKLDLPFRPRIFQQDATKPFPKFPVDAVVTEGYLGWPIQRPLKTSDLSKHLRPVERIYTGFFPQVSRILTSGQYLVLSLPYFRGERGDIFLDPQLLDLLKKDFEFISLAWGKWKNPAPAIRPSFLYRRDNQTVGREIFVCKRK